jgi:hypothetical protein
VLFSKKLINPFFFRHFFKKISYEKKNNKGMRFQPYVFKYLPDGADEGDFNFDIR